MKNKRFNRNPAKSYRDPEEFFTGAKVAVRGDDVNGALRRLKKILENDNFQKDLAKHEFYEKPSVKNKRSRDMAKRRAKRDRMRNVLTNEVPSCQRKGTKWMKSKRKRREVIDRNAMLDLLNRKKR